MDLVDLFLHLDKHLASIIQTFGPLTYIILFAIIFAETGLVVVPFLPGDSLLFIVGTLAGTGFLNIFLVYSVLLVAAILGDTVNYWLGHHFGAKVFSKKNSVLFNKAYLEKTREFYVKHGGKTIVLARFLPIIRTFAPFVAGIGRMHYGTFFLYNVVGGFIWVSLFMLAGYFFGGLSIVKENFEYAVLIIVFLSVIPVIAEVVRHKLESRRARKKSETTSYKEIQKTFKKEHLND